MNVKGTAGKSSEGNEKHIIGTWKKREPSYTVAESLAELCQLCGKLNLQVMNLDVQLRRFPSQVLKMQPGSFLPLT